MNNTEPEQTPDPNADKPEQVAPSNLEQLRSAIPSLQNNSETGQKKQEEIEFLLKDIKSLLEKNQNEDKEQTEQNTKHNYQKELVQTKPVPKEIEVSVQNHLPTFSTRFLPPSERAELQKPTMMHSVPIVSGAIGVATGFALAFAAPLGFSIWAALGSAINLGLSFLLAGYVIAFSYHLLKQSNYIEKQKKVLDTEFSEPFSRFRVMSKSRGPQVVLQLVEYRAQHKMGERPHYSPEIIKEQAWDSKEDVEIFEGLAHIKEEASERESVSRAGWEQVRQAMDLQTQVRHQLSS